MLRKLLIAVGLATLSSNIFAVSIYVDDFPSADSSVVASSGSISAGEFGYFWSVSRGDSITETFATGQNAVDQLYLDFAVTRNFLNQGASTNWDVLVNGVNVGSWTWSAGDGTGRVTDTYEFTPIIGAGSYTVSMRVTNDVPGGRGSIAIGHPGEMRLKSVPDSGSTVLLLGTGLLLVGVIGTRRRRNRLGTANS